MKKERALLANALRNSLFSFYQSLKHVEALLAVASGAGRIVLEKRSVRKNNLHAQRPPTARKLLISLTHPH
ncbi:hypothetical protein [Paenibacillus polymyxa]|uniref:hypothetical protein n=1 Tax=Paenibacillus polymyxa TaxID=1406 RepID=UPI0018AD3752|nr:hypothetical protein [Paenibacillus polymyxa]